MTRKSAGKPKIRPGNTGASPERVPILTPKAGVPRGKVLAPRARSLIRKLKLIPHPEGGYYREIHRAGETVKTSRGERSAMTTIYFLMPRGECSRFHRVKSDEVWHHYEGAALRLIRLNPNLFEAEEIRLGALDGKAAPVAVIARGQWQAAESLGDYTLVGCSVGPGFDFADFEMIDADRGAALRKRRPALARFTV